MVIGIQTIWFQKQSISYYKMLPRLHGEQLPGNEHYEIPSDLALVCEVSWLMPEGL